MKKIYVILIALTLLVSCFGQPPDIHVGHVLYKTQVDNRIKPPDNRVFFVFVEDHNKRIIRLTVEPEVYESLQKGEAVQYRTSWCGHLYSGKF